MRKKSQKILSKKTIAKVRGGVSGVWSKTILLRFFNFETLPKEHLIRKHPHLPEKLKL